VTSVVPTVLQRQGIVTEAIGGRVPVIYDPSTTVTHLALEIGRDDLTDLHEVVPLTDIGHVYDSAAFSFDGKSLVYTDCRKLYDEMFCDLKTVDLGSLVTTTVLEHQPWIIGAAFVPDGSSIVMLQSKTEFLQSYSDVLRHVDLKTHEVSTLCEESTSTIVNRAFCVTSE